MNRPDPFDEGTVAPSQLSPRQATDAVAGSQQRAAPDAAVWRQRAADAPGSTSAESAARAEAPARPAAQAPIADGLAAVEAHAAKAAQRLPEVPPPGARTTRAASPARPGLAGLPPGGQRTSAAPPVAQASAASETRAASPDAIAVARAAMAGLQRTAAASAGSAASANGVNAGGAADAERRASHATGEAKVRDAAGTATASPGATPARAGDGHAGRSAFDQPFASNAQGAGEGTGAPPMSAWATPVGASTQAQFHPSAGKADDGQQSGGISRPAMWGMVLLIAITLAGAGIWLARHFNTERELAVLARVAAIPGAEAPRGASGSPPPPAPTQASAAPAATNAVTGSPDRATIAQAAGGRTQSTPVPVPEAPPAAERTPLDNRTVLPMSVPQTAAQAAAPSVNARPPQASVRKPVPGAPAVRREPSIPNSERAMAKLSPKAREYLYSQAFRRCPAPGLPGALQCRKHICNGAEGRSAACYHINRLNL